jgi:hypothetical protein
LTSIFTKGSTNENGDFYFVISTLDMSQSSKLPLFKLGNGNAYISINGPQATSFTTGAAINFDVLTNLLPSRQITCNLQHKEFLGLTTKDYGVIASVNTTSATTVQKSSVCACLIVRHRLDRSACA